MFLWFGDWIQEFHSLCHIHLIQVQDLKNYEWRIKLQYCACLGFKPCFKILSNTLYKVFPQKVRKRVHRFYRKAIRKKFINCDRKRFQKNLETCVGKMFGKKVQKFYQKVCRKKNCLETYCLEKYCCQYFSFPFVLQRYEYFSVGMWKVDLAASGNASQSCTKTDKKKKMSWRATLGRCSHSENLQNIFVCSTLKLTDFLSFSMRICFYIFKKKKKKRKNPT